MGDVTVLWVRSSAPTYFVELGLPDRDQPQLRAISSAALSA